MHTLLIFLTTCFLVSPDITEASFLNFIFREKGPKHVLPQASTIGRYRENIDEVELRMSAFLYNALYVYNIQPENQIDHDNWEEIRNSIKYDDGLHSQCFRTDYPEYLYMECKLIDEKKSKYIQEDPQKASDLLLLANILSQEKDSEERCDKIGRFAIQAGTEIHNRHPKPIAVKKQIVSLNDIENIKIHQSDMQQHNKLESIKAKFKANPQKFYKELIPTLQSMYPEKCAQNSSSSDK